MFRNRLTYYHGTTEARWMRIQSERVFRPNDTKAVGKYWITKGAYFVCENPLVALWYAYLACWTDKREGDPILIAIEYEADRHRTGEVVNLLTADGQAVLAHAHSKFQSVIPPELAADSTVNLDSTVLELLLTKTLTAKAVIAAFQEGTSYQRLLNDGSYRNPYVTHQTGVCPGDHAEICFVPELSLENVDGLRVVDHEPLIDGRSQLSPLWPLVCRGLVGDWVNKEKGQEFADYLAKVCPGADVG